MTPCRRWFAPLLLALAAMFAPGVFAQGAEGKIAFTRFVHAPDGVLRQINLYRINPDGSGVRRLTPTVDGNLRFDPAWSPHGTWLAYSLLTASTDSWDLWIVDANGTTRRRVSMGASDFRYPSWHPSGNLIGFHSTANDGSTCVGAVRPDGTGQRSVLCAPPGQEMQDTAPFWLPDGRMLAVVRRIAENEVNTFLDVYRITVSTGARTLVRTVEAGGEYDLFFSPDGRRAMLSTRFQGSTLIYVDLETGEMRGFGGGYSPVWAPDSRRIAYARIVRNTGFPSDDVGHLFVADVTVPESDRDLNVSLLPGLHYVPNAWSPDGTRILATRTVFEPTRAVHTLRLFDADSPYIETLTSGWGAMGAWFSPP